MKENINQPNKIYTGESHTVLSPSWYRSAKIKGFESVQKSFERLPVDPYIEGSFRQRRLTRMIAPKGKLRALPHKEFIQSDQYNQLLGNIRREYQELEADVVLSDYFIDMLAEISNGLDLNMDSTVFGVHQIRIVSHLNEQGSPAPEGIHRDGFDYIVVICIQRKNVSGGHTELYEDRNGSAIFSKQLEPGDILYCDDTQLFHFTTPLQLNQSESGFRDVFVVTVKTGANTFE